MVSWESPHAVAHVDPICIFSYRLAAFLFVRRIAGNAVMSSSAEHAPAPVPLGFGGLPPQMKVLTITSPDRAGGWLTEAFAADSATQILLEEVVGVSAGLARLRDELFDAVLVSHVPGVMDALDMVEGLRAGGNDLPIILFGSVPPEQLDALCYEVGADDYCCVDESTVRGLMWKFARAIQRHQLVRENRRLVQAERQRLRQEHCEAERLLQQQRALIADLEILGNGRQPGDKSSVSIDDCLVKNSAGGSSMSLALPKALVGHYRELLRTYIIMGAGNLSKEMTELAELLAMSNVSARRAMQLHVEVLEEQVQSLGNRSARHVINRADLLVLEVMAHLADGYRQRFLDRIDPLRQLPLPGFTAAA